MAEYALHPERVRAVITTPWTDTGYIPITVRSIESFYIESNMDQDSDNFNIVVGDPRNQLSSLMYRDGEIRIQLFGIGHNVDYLLTGIVDDVEHSDDGRYIITGRDRSAIAADTIAAPGKWLEQRANEFIEKQARDMGVTSKFSLADGPVLKTVRTDGSETAWELWYRLIRKEQQWLWFTSDGRLVSSKLGYDAPPSYFFGTPPSNLSQSQANQWLPVEKISFRKTTQTRVGHVVLFYKDQNDRVMSVTATDGTTEGWEKRPSKYIEDTKVSTESKAKKAAWEEIFESKVGALEIKITIPDTGQIIRTNRIAKLRVPEIDIGGHGGNNWFIVGTRIIAGEDGYTQEIRLREKGYGLTRRIPSDPEVNKAPSTNEDDIADCIDLAKIPNVRWIQYFVNAAYKWQENVPYDLYLATLLAICDQESSFKNVRQPAGGPEYFKWDGKPQNGVGSKEEWLSEFKNDGPPDVVGVGPMQLTTQSFKEKADKFAGGRVDEFYGNRWLPEANIMVAAEVLSGKGAKSEGTLWAGVKAYNGSGADAENYMNIIKKKVYSNPGYLEMVQKAIEACREDGKFGDDDDVKNGILIPIMSDTDHCTGNLESFYAKDFMGSALQKVYMDEPVKADPSYGQSPHLQSWRDGVGGWTFQLLGESGTQYWVTHLDENDPNRYSGGKLPANGYIGRLTDSALKAKLINGAHVHVGSPQWPFPGRCKRGCPC